MRLICPRCGAQYEIPDTAIPASGREVECSACSHVWRQDGPAPAAPAPAFEGGHRSDQHYDPAARPALNRPLHESVLAILREETARELSARREAGRETVPDAGSATDDHIDASRTAAPAAPPDPAGPRHESSLPPAEEIVWPVTTVILPGDPLPMGGAAEAPPAEASKASAPSTPEPADPPREVVSAEAETEAAPVSTPAPSALPDAAQLAATLTRKPDPAEAAPEDAPPVETVTEAQPERSTAVLLRPAADPVPLPPKVAVIVPDRSHSGYWLGFGLAVAVAAGLAAFYSLAPDEGSSLAAEWKADLDRGRIWLHDRATALMGGLGGTD
ncbi:zinc-ribbon domain-containing protein [Paracoccus sp. MBLB3053]|uniref:Zinc-ribbon domain-containing protein n=1 Tax=Paracoccus aurantius TaxID=3073814 RepID=A0ABU2HML5_9RHOB|nr:zinc-ribbon domain-containing protein [Paracoccus sp. MBLB3053]MDS9466266.1 zinc-ribbon domain-containing protein [Paracoccus sp. MBLB3053]